MLRVPGSIIRHPLQPFSPRYFDGKSALFSYARRHFEGAKRLSQPRTSVPRFVDVPLPAGDAERVVTVDDLARFFENPARGFLQRRLGLSLGRDSQPLDDREPLELDQLERWKIGTSLLGRAIDGDDIRLTLPLLRAAGVLPPGTLGEYPMTTILPEVDGLARATARFIAGTKLEPLEIDCVVAGTRLLGRLEHLWPAGQVQYQYSRTATNRELGLWIRHVVLNCAASGDLPRTTILIGRGGKGTFKIVRLKPVPEALERLRQLVELYWLGQLVPLPLLPQCSRAFAEALRSNPDIEKALRKARKLLRPERGFGDGDDAYFQQVYGDHDPFAAVDWSAELVVPTFARLARQIFDPLFDHREELDD